MDTAKKRDQDLIGILKWCGLAVLLAGAYLLYCIGDGFIK